MATVTEISKRRVILYPDSDGMPMAENTLQYEWIVTLKGGLDAIYLDDPNVFVAGDLLWYPVEGEPTIRCAPDVLVAFGRPKGYRGSYKQWEEGNQPPQVVFEVLSPGNRHGEMIRKFEFYQRYGVEEYYVYDPDHGPLEGWVRAGDRLQEVPEMAGFVSPRLEIRFDPGDGADNLKIYGPDGARFLTFAEWVEKAKADERRADSERQRADAERLHAETERQRADIEHQRAEAERERAEADRQRAEVAELRLARLAARLRELGIEPE
jgi:Uma2 family endonuclease